MTAGPVPKPTPQTVPFWDGTRQGELRVQRCLACGRHYFYPRPICRYCQSPEVEWVTTSGRATLASYIINHRPLPVFEIEGPQVIALVDLEEGPRMVSNLIGVEPRPDAISIGMALTVSFQQRGDQVLPVFSPAEAGGE